MLVISRRSLGTHKLPLSMPDLSHPKWARRDKLNPINFANKGKDNRLRRGKKENVQNIKNTKTDERLPAEKYSVQISSREVDKHVNDIVSAFKVENDRITYHTGKSTIVKRQPLDKEFVTEISKQEKNDLNSFLAAEILEQPDYFLDISASEYQKVIYANSRLGRHEEAQKAFDLMLADGVTPTIRNYNTLMNAYANSRDKLSDVVRIFQSMKSANISPDSASYGILIKALTASRRLTDAFQVYKEMKTSNIPITQPIYTTLIKGCTKVGDYNRSWKLFEHLQSQVLKPDAVTYNLMLHICARTGQAERAFKLYDQMINSEIHPTDSTFNSLIHACSKNKKYYTRTFHVVAQMSEAGFKPDDYTYNYMLDACALQGDIIRAKALFNELQDPITASLNALVRCYARVPVFLVTLNEMTRRADNLDGWKKKMMESKVGLDNEKRIEEGLKPVDVTEWVLDENYDPDEKFSMEDAFGKSYQDIRDYALINGSFEETLLHYRKETLSLCTRLIGTLSSSTVTTADVDNLPVVVAEKQGQITKPLMNSIMAALGTFGMRKQLVEVFDTKFLEYKVQKDSYSYFQVITCLTNPLVKSSKSNIDKEITYLNKSLEYLSEYEKYRARVGMPDNWMDLETKFLKTKLLEKGVSHSLRKYEYRIYRSIIRALVEHDEVYRATALLKLVLDRGHARSVNMSDTYNPLLGGRSDDDKMPQYATPANEFNLGDFEGLLNRTQVKGLYELERKVSSMFKQAKRQRNMSVERELTRQIK